MAGLDPTRWIEVRYEAVCSDTTATLVRICRFIGVANHVARDFRAVEQHVIGNGMRLDTTSEIRLDDAWRNTLTVGDLAAFDAVAGDLNRRLGYE